jgi:hypothetical protein
MWLLLLSAGNSHLLLCPTPGDTRLALDQRQRSIAQRQVEGSILAALCAEGAAIEFVDPAPDLPDHVFTANAALVLDGKALLSRFGAPGAQERGTGLRRHIPQIAFASLSRFGRGTPAGHAWKARWRLHLGSTAPAVLDGLRSTLGPRGGPYRRRPLRSGVRRS